MPNRDSEFTVQELVSGSRVEKTKPFTSSHVNRMLSSLSGAGLVYKNRHGKYSFAVPLFVQFIRRQPREEGNKHGTMDLDFGDPGT